MRSLLSAGPQSYSAAPMPLSSTESVEQKNQRSESRLPVSNRLGLPPSARVDPKLSVISQTSYPEAALVVVEFGIENEVVAAAVLRIGAVAGIELLVAEALLCLARSSPLTTLVSHNDRAAYRVG